MRQSHLQGESASVAYTVKIGIELLLWAADRAGFGRRRRVVAPCTGRFSNLSLLRAIFRRHFTRL